MLASALHSSLVSSHLILSFQGTQFLLFLQFLQFLQVLVVLNHTHTGLAYSFTLNIKSHLILPFSFHSTALWLLSLCFRSKVLAFFFLSTAADSDIILALSYHSCRCQ